MIKTLTIKDITTWPDLGSKAAFIKITITIRVHSKKIYLCYPQYLKGFWHRWWQAWYCMGYIKFQDINSRYPRVIDFGLTLSCFRKNLSNMRKSCHLQMTPEES